MSSTAPISDLDPLQTYYLGLALAISSSLFIGCSFVIKKISLMRVNKSGGLRAGAGGFGYLKDWIWWFGFLCMGLGELFNFAAYAFAPASLVTPLGAISVLVSAVLAAKFLKERLNWLGKLGCLLCILGSIVIILHSPKQNEIESLTVLLERLQDTIFIKYITIVIFVNLLIIFYVGPQYGNRYILIYLLICSSIGSLTVMACKGLGLAIKQLFYNNFIDNNNEKMWIFIFFLTVSFCISIQMNYLNKSLDLFNMNLVTPIYYVLFTSFVIVVSGILFNEFNLMSISDIFGGLCGFFVVILAIFLLQNFKEIDYFNIDKQFKQNYLLRSV